MVLIKDSHMSFSPLNLILCTTLTITFKIASQLFGAFIRPSVTDLPTLRSLCCINSISALKPHEIEVGDIVFTRIQDRHSKLDPQFNGPHRVIEKMAGHKVKLRNLSSGSENLVHRDHLKRVDHGFDIESTSPLPENAPDSVNSQSPSPLILSSPKYRLRSRTVY